LKTTVLTTEQTFHGVTGTTDRNQTRIGIGLFLGLLAAFWFTSCCPEDPFVPTRPPVVIDSNAQGFVRFVIADPDIEDVEIMAGDSILFDSTLGYLDYPEGVYEAEFWPIDTGDINIRFIGTGGAPVASRQFHLVANTYRTVYLFQDGDEHGTTVTFDDPTNSPGSSQVRYRIVNMAVGAPPVSVKFNNEDPAVTGVAYGDTSAIVTRSSSITDSMVVTRTSDGAEILKLPNVVLFGDAVLTLVLTGKLNPRGNEPMLFLAVFQDQKRNEETKLFGDLPLSIRLCAVRFVNLVSSGDSTLDLTFRDDQFGTSWPDNFRRNFAGQLAVLNRAPITTDPSSWESRYFFHGTFFSPDKPYRVEIKTLPFWQDATYGSQPVLVQQHPFTIVADARFTVAAYGPFEQGQAEATTIRDNPNNPPADRVGLRFFHGSFRDHQSDVLRLRVQGSTGPGMAYGDAPVAPNDEFYTSASSGATMEVIDEQNQVVFTQSGIALEPDKTYSVFFSDGKYGNEPAIAVVSDDVVPE
jgi:hypothetical protein